MTEAGLALQPPPAGPLSSPPTSNQANTLTHSSQARAEATTRTDVKLEMREENVSIENYTVYSSYSDIST